MIPYFLLIKTRVSLSPFRITLQKAIPMSKSDLIGSTASKNAPPHLLSRAPLCSALRIEGHQFTYIGYTPIMLQFSNQTQNVGYLRFLSRLLIIKATITMSTDPINTGAIRKDQLLPLRITTKGSAPAGGCVVLLSIIKPIARPTATAITQML